MATLHHRITHVLLALVLLALLTLIAMVASDARGGPLDPGGSPAPTRPQVEPRHPVPPVGWDGTFPITLSAPGSYFLTDDVYKPIDTPPAIVIDASNVTLDLNGFAVRQRGCSQADTTPGILISGFDVLTNVRIEHGAVEGACGPGIEARNGSNPVSLAVEGLMLSDLLLSSNGAGGDPFHGAGLDASFALHGVYERIIARKNAGMGISGGSVTSLSDCVAMANGRMGVEVLDASTVSGCTANENGEQGFSLGRSTTIEGCAAQLNVGHGIFAGIAVRIDGCNVWGNQGRGIETDFDAIVTNCSAGSNQSDGILVGQRSVVRDCTASANSGSGIVAGNDSVVSGSTANDNALHGIRAASSMVMNNHADGNGTAIADGSGILADGSTAGARIEGNNVSFNDVGIRVTAPTTNVIVRNSATANGTEFVIPGGNVAPIEASLTPASPWANIDY